MDRLVPRWRWSRSCAQVSAEITRANGLPRQANGYGQAPRPLLLTAPLSRASATCKIGAMPSTAPPSILGLLAMVCLAVPATGDLRLHRPGAVPVAP
jgi:hypothetical protein